MRQTLQMGAITAVQILGGLAQLVISARILGPEGFSALAVLPAAVGRVWPLLAGQMGAFAVFVAVLVWLIPLHGAEGAAWANTTYYGVIALILLPFAISILRESRRPRQKP